MKTIYITKDTQLSETTEDCHENEFFTTTGDCHVIVVGGVTADVVHHYNGDITHMLNSKGDQFHHGNGNQTHHGEGNKFYKGTPIDERGVQFVDGVRVK